MIKKLRRKIMFVLLGVMCFFLIAILSTLFASYSRSMDRTPKGNKPPEKQSEQTDTSFQTPVAFARVSSEGDIVIESNQISDLSESEIQSIVEDLKTQDADRGDVAGYSLRYMRHPGRNGIVYLFADTTFEQKAIKNQVINTLVVAIISIFCFIIASYFLALWMVKPVESVWNQQRQFIADASHELKTPLTVILSNTDMIIQSGAVTDSKNRQRLDNINVESRRMRELVESLLTLARSDHAPKPLLKERLNLSYLVSSSVLTLEPSIYDAGHNLEFTIEPDLFCNANAQDITKLIEILIDNACKYSDPGSQIDLTLEKIKKEALLTVSSRGVPLSKEDCINIFERFYRLEPSREVHQGYGLGLSIAYEAVQHFGGSISASSNGIDTNNFQVHFPLA
ncbi:MAG: HAMP domain-containing histidine kinase [Clostridia bacterium]|nr:HAMP domain-containing histidine kinase [Clostridia bacterium]